MIDFENDWFWKLIIITFLMEWSLSPHWKWNWSYMYKGKMYIDHEKTWDLISKWIAFCIIYPKTNTLPGSRWCHSSRAQRRRGRGLKWLNIQPRIRPPTPARSFCICAGTDHTWGREKWRSNKICLCPPVAARLYSGAHNKSSHRQVVQLRHNGNCPAQPWGKNVLLVTLIFRERTCQGCPWAVPWWREARSELFDGLDQSSRCRPGWSVGKVRYKFFRKFVGNWL